MFAKSTITLFVFAVGLLLSLSGNSIGSASAYPQPDGTSMNVELNDSTDMRFLESIKDVRHRNNLGSDTVIHNNVIQGSNSTGENHFGTEVDQKNIVVGGVLPDGGHNYGGYTFSDGNTIQLSDSNVKNFMSSRLTQEDVTYNVKAAPKK